MTEQSGILKLTNLGKKDGINFFCFLNKLYYGNIHKWQNAMSGEGVSLGEAIQSEPNFEKFLILYFNQNFDQNSWNPNQSS